MKKPVDPNHECKTGISYTKREHGIRYVLFRCSDCRRVQKIRQLDKE